MTGYLKKAENFVRDNVPGAKYALRRLYEDPKSEDPLVLRFFKMLQRILKCRKWVPNRPGSLCSLYEGDGRGCRQHIEKLGGLADRPDLLKRVANGHSWHTCPYVQHIGESFFASAKHDPNCSLKYQLRANTEFSVLYPSHRLRNPWNWWSYPSGEILPLLWVEDFLRKHGKLPASYVASENEEDYDISGVLTPEEESEVITLLTKGEDVSKRFKDPVEKHLLWHFANFVKKHKGPLSEWQVSCMRILQYRSAGYEIPELRRSEEEAIQRMLLFSPFALRLHRDVPPSRRLA
jgi:hypothetical protein